MITPMYSRCNDDDESIKNFDYRRISDMKKMKRGKTLLLFFLLPNTNSWLS